MVVFVFLLQECFPKNLEEKSEMDNSYFINFILFVLCISLKVENLKSEIRTFLEKKKDGSI